MNIAAKYGKSYFMPPEVTYDWVKKDSIEKPPIWCSVDLRDGNQALIEPMGLEEKLEFSGCWSTSDLRRSRSVSRQLRTRNTISCVR